MLKFFNKNFSTINYIPFLKNNTNNAKTIEQNKLTQYLFIDYPKQKNNNISSVYKKIENNLVSNKNLLDTSFFIFRKDLLDHKIKEWKYHLPFIKTFYAMKAGSNQLIVNEMYKNGFHFDLCSVIQYEQVKSFILYNKCKISKELSLIYTHMHQLAHESTFVSDNKHINLLSVDSSIKNKEDDYFQKDKSYLIKIDVKDYNNSEENQGKFGCTMEELCDMLKNGKDNNINIQGLSFHIGANTLINSYETSLKNALTIIEKMIPVFKKYHDLKVVNIGGGFNEYTDLSVVSDILHNFKSKYSIQIYAEPGRYFAICYDLCVRILNKRIRNGVITYIVNDSIYQSFSGIKYDHWKLMNGDKQHLVMFNSLGRLVDDYKKLYKSIIVGNTCDWEDCIINDIMLPEMDVGDCLVFNKKGDYSYVSNSAFNDIITGRNFIS